jgi:hypothetical protein
VALIQRSFAAGELALALSARADLPQYLSGLRTCRNFVVQRHGGVTNRTGSRLVAETKTSGSSEAFLKRFSFAAADQSYIIECGDLYFRFHYKGAPVVVASATAWAGATAYTVGDLASRSGVIYYALEAHTNQQPPNATYWYPLPIVAGEHIYELASPYVAGRFKAPAPAHFEQSGDTITITHLDEPMRVLRREGATRWVLSDVIAGPWTDPPDNANGSIGVGSPGTRTYHYVVTAAREETYEETLPSAVVDIALANEPTNDTPLVVSWDAVTGAVEYYLYGDGAAGNGTFGFLGASTLVNLFQDIGYLPDFGQAPPVGRPLFDAVNKYPAVSCIYQQRRFCAGTHTDREIVYASQTGFYDNFGIRSPLQDDDALTFRLASKEINPVQHLVELEVGLVLLTTAGEWLLIGDPESGALTPTAINPKRVGYVGSSWVSPVVVGDSVLFVQAHGNILRDLRPMVQRKGLSGEDLSLLANHLFKGTTIVQLAYAQVPHSVVWAVRSDGVLLGLTYVPEQEVFGWHRHDTDGAYEQVCTLPEDGEDAVYVVVRREIGGVTRRFIERFDSRQFTDVKDAFFVDCGLTYSGSPATHIFGLAHLEGKTVKVAADGAAVAGTFVVHGGAIDLPAAKSTVHVGLPITAELETLDLDVAGADLRGRRKRVVALDLILEASARGFLVGPDANNLVAHRGETWQATGLVTGQEGLTLTTNFNERGRILIRHTDPLPLTILGLIPQVDVGG